MARVLVVEDEQTDRLILAGIIQGAGHEVFFASDGEQAYKTFVRMSIDVVVTDLLMPNVDGLEFIVALRTLFPDAPVIAVSGKGAELLAEAEKKGANVVLDKPVDPEALLEAVAAAVPENSNVPIPKSKVVVRDNYRPLDEFEFEHGVLVRCIPAGGVITVDQADGKAGHTIDPFWEIRVEGDTVGRVDANLDETQDSVREAAARLIDQLQS